MKPDKKVFIDCLEFCKTAKFACIEPNQDAQWISNHFPQPDNIEDMGDGIQIWCYGNIEFHFIDNLLHMIFSDHFNDKTLYGGKSISIKPWIFTKNKVTLKKALKKFNAHHMDYQKTSTKLNIEVRLSSGVVLYFENTKDIKDLDPNQYRLIAFALPSERRQENQTTK